jgi:ribosomal protein S19E (S16A)
MSDETELELTPDQWEALKAMRAPAATSAKFNRFALERLIVLGLVAARDGTHVITEQGRKVLIRGSSRLLHDLAA